MDFLSIDEPFKFQSLLVSFAEYGVIYLNEDFNCYFNNVNILLRALQLAQCLVNQRIQYRQCTCLSQQRLSFTDVLIKHFANRTLFHYLLNGDDKELDNFKVDVRVNFAAFDVYAVNTAYHKVRCFKDELISARNVIVVNPFLSTSDFDDSETSL